MHQTKYNSIIFYSIKQSNYEHHKKEKKWTSENASNWILCPWNYYISKYLSLYIQLDETQLNNSQCTLVWVSYITPPSPICSMQGQTFHTLFVMLRIKNLNYKIREIFKIQIKTILNNNPDNWAKNLTICFDINQPIVNFIRPAGLT